MKHFVYLKFTKETSGQEMLRLMTERMEGLLPEVAGFQSYQLMQAEAPPDNGITFLIELTFADDGAKAQYLAHPMHLAMLHQVCSQLVDKAAFDR